MKKILFSLFTLFFSFFTLALPAWGAQTTPKATASSQKEIRQEATQGAGTGVRQTVREETRESIQEKTATFQARLSLRKRETVRNYFDKIIRRLGAAINRLNRLSERIESRLAKIEQTDPKIKTTVIKKDLASAKEKLNNTTLQLDQVKTKINDLIESETPKENFEEIKIMIGEIKSNLIEIHQILVKVIGDIKGLRVGETSTPSATME